jgi:membrane-associated phospholipid phosphatase
MNGFPVKLTWPAWYWLTAVCFLAFVAVTWRMLAQGPHSFDMDCAEYFQAHAEGHVWVRNLFWALTQLGSAWALGTLAGLAISVLIRRKQRFFAVVWLFAVAGGALLNYGMKGEFERSRPPVSMRDPAVAQLASWSYPSGHSMGSAIGIGLCAYLALRRVHWRRRKIASVSGLVLLIALIGFSRIYLRAHWCSDVLGGITVGTAWLIFCLGIYEWRRGTLQVPLPAYEVETEEEI